MRVLYVQQSLMSKLLCGALVYQPLSPVSHNGMRSDWLTKQAWKRVREKCQKIRKLLTERRTIDCGTQIQSFILSCFSVILYGIVTAHIQVQKSISEKLLLFQHLLFLLCASQLFELFCFFYLYKGKCCNHYVFKLKLSLPLKYLVPFSFFIDVFLIVHFLNLRKSARTCHYVWWTSHREEL